MAGDLTNSREEKVIRYTHTQHADTRKLTRRAAKILDVRVPKRTNTESAAQPMAEKMATISGSKMVVRRLVRLNAIQFE
jgi:hypothetical protein